MLMYFTRPKGSEIEKKLVSSNESEELHPMAIVQFSGVVSKLFTLFSNFLTGEAVLIYSNYD